MDTLYRIWYSIITIVKLYFYLSILLGVCLFGGGILLAMVDDLLGSNLAAIPLFLIGFLTGGIPMWLAMIIWMPCIIIVTIIGALFRFMDSR